MIVYPTSRFKKSYRRLSVSVKNKAKIKDEIFKRDPFSSILDTHKLKGKLKNYRSYSVDKSYRVLFKFENRNKVIYFDIGTHKIYR